MLDFLGQDFMRPERLWWLLLVPLIGVLYVVLLRRGRRQARPHSSSRLQQILPKQQAWKRHVAVAAALLSLATLTLAFAQPSGEVEVPRERATIVMTIDVSQSMAATDVTPNRIEAAKEAAQQFLTMVPDGFNVALVQFAGTPSILVPPTTDRGIVAAAIQGLQLAPATATGDAIYTSLDAVDQAPPDPNDPEDVAPAAIVLLSDGKRTIGLPPVPAATEAGQKGVPIYTIAYGTASGYLEQEGQRTRVPVDEEELRQVADASGGEAFRAASAGQLTTVYSTIAREVGMTTVDEEVTERWAGWALGFAVLAGLAMISLAARWP